MLDNSPTALSTLDTYVPPEIGKDYVQGGVLFVGRDPGINELSEGRPFIGASGQVFNLALRQGGFWRKDIAIHNVVPIKPWSNEFYRHKTWQIEAGMSELRALVKKLKPGLIVAMGNEACYQLIPRWATLGANDRRPTPGGKTIFSAAGIMDRRGFFWQKSTLGPPVMATLHPANVVYQEMPNRWLLERDMERAKAFMDGDLPFEPFPPVRRALTGVDLLVHEDEELLAFDIEVDERRELLCVALCGENLKPTVTYADDLEIIRPILQSDQREKVAHNGGFDTYLLEYHHAEHPLRVGAYNEDTIAMWWAMYPELAGKRGTGLEEGFEGGTGGRRLTRKSLLFLASLYLNVGWWKEYTNDPEKMGVLCGRDTYVTRRLHQEMHPWIEKLGVDYQYRNAMRLTPLLNSIQSRGLLVDRDLWKERRTSLGARMKSNIGVADALATKWLAGSDLRNPLWQKTLQCKCCGGGSKKTAQCWSCAGFDRAPTKKMLLERGGSGTKTDLEHLHLGSCVRCKGEGKVETWHFNSMSSQQMTELLYDVIKVPKGTLQGDQPNATEETLRRVLEWATH